MNGYRQNGERARIIIILFITHFAVMVASIAAQLWQFSEGIAYENGTTDSVRLTNSDSVVSIITFAFLITSILCMIYFIRWFRRAYFNLIFLSPRDTSYTEGWAAGAWFVPFMNFVRPYRIMQELWHGSLKLVSGNRNNNYPSTLIGAWWITWLLYNFTYRTSNKIEMDISSMENFRSQIILHVVGEVIGLTSLVFIILLVRSYAELEKRVEEAISLPQDSIFALNTNVAYYESRQSASENQASNNE